MNSINTKEGLIHLVTDEHNEPKSILGKLSDDAIVKSGVQGDWSVKDIVAHITVWQERGTRWIQDISKGINPNIPLEGHTWRDYDQLNEEIYQKNRSKPIDEIVNQLEKSFEELIETIENFPQDKLEEAFYPEGARQSSFSGKEIISFRYIHYKSHIKHIETWLEQSGI
jgi:hypothetical protein